MGEGGRKDRWDGPSAQSLGHYSPAQGPGAVHGHGRSPPDHASPFLDEPPGPLPRGSAPAAPVPHRHGGRGQPCGGGTQGDTLPEVPGHLITPALSMRGRGGVYSLAERPAGAWAAATATGVSSSKEMRPAVTRLPSSSTSYRSTRPLRSTNSRQQSLQKYCRVPMRPTRCPLHSGHATNGRYCLRAIMTLLSVPAG